MMKKVLLIMLALLFTAVLSAEASQLTWAGCGISKNAFMKEMSQAYKDKTGVDIQLRGGGATKGIRTIADGTNDIGGACRHKMDIPEEAGAVMHHVAWDALVIIVNKANPIDGLTSDQVRDIYTGKIKNWKELGGTDDIIKLHVRKGKSSGVGMTLRQSLFKDVNAKFTDNAIVKKSSGPLEKAVSNLTTAIGATGISSAVKRDDIKILAIDGVMPTKEGVMTGKYPFYRPLYLVSNLQATDEVKKFIDFVKSSEGQSIISSEGTINIAEGSKLSLD
ncbi:phosphate ABC transporter substrate-binding protein [bacterium]|nr:phosphate ABC transporter substrate-binding protein [bacterium]